MRKSPTITRTIESTTYSTADILCPRLLLHYTSTKSCINNGVSIQPTMSGKQWLSSRNLTISQSVMTANEIQYSLAHRNGGRHCVVKRTVKFPALTLGNQTARHGNPVKIRSLGNSSRSILMSNTKRSKSVSI